VNEQDKTILEKEPKPPTEESDVNMDEIYEAIEYIKEYGNEEDIKRIGNELTLENKKEIIKWVKIKKFHDHWDKQEEENMRKKINAKKGLPPDPKTARIWDAEWEVAWAIFKENRDKINAAKEKWMEGETDNWEE
jgi:hypothetical protein